MRGRVLVGATALVAVVAACGGSSHGTKAGSTSSGPQTYTVNVDGKNAETNESFLAFFPKNVQVHGGDSIEFHYMGVGEPHTVTMGAPVNDVLKQFEALTPQQQQGPPPPALQRADAKIPSLFPQGPGDANQVVAGPCYIATGAIPAKGACPNTTPAPFTGTESLYNSGWFDTDGKWNVTLSSSIAPGTYRYMCSLHREGMVGHITVLPKSQTAPSPAAQEATGQQELQAIEGKLASAATALTNGQLPLGGLKPPGTTKNVAVLAGSGSQDVQNAQIDEFGPRDVSIPVGGSVTWYYLGDHSIAINAPQSGKGARLPGANGSAHINVAAVSPHGGPGEPPPAQQNNGPGNGPPKFKVVAHATFGGSGWFSTGLFLNSFGPPLIEGYQVTFSKVGTYSYICTIHDKMKGTIHVG